jgi:hypothetical protein
MLLATSLKRFKDTLQESIRHKRSFQECEKMYVCIWLLNLLWRMMMLGVEFDPPMYNINTTYAENNDRFPGDGEMSKHATMIK